MELTGRTTVRRRREIAQMERGKRTMKWKLRRMEISWRAASRAPLLRRPEKIM